MDYKGWPGGVYAFGPYGLPTIGGFNSAYTGPILYCVTWGGILPYGGRVRRMALVVGPVGREVYLGNPPANGRIERSAE